MPIGNSPELLSQQLVVEITLVESFGVRLYVQALELVSLGLPSWTPRPAREEHGGAARVYGLGQSSTAGLGFRG